MIDRIRSLIREAQSSQLAKDTLTMSVGHAFRLAVMACYFIAIARTLGVKQYGVFVAISAMIGVVTPFAGIGGPVILLKNVSRDRNLLPVYWANGIFLVLVSGSIFTIVLLLFGTRWVGNNLFAPIFFLAVSELILARVVELASFAWTALGKMRQTALLNVYISLSRLICILGLGAIKAHPTVQEWSEAVFCGSVVCCFYSLYGIAPKSGVRLDFRRMRRELAESVYFSVGSSAASFYNDVDKTMLARLSDLGSTGIYGAAYRLIDVSMAPVRAMTASSYSEFFRRGAGGAKATSQYAYHLIKKSSLFGTIVAAGLLVGAPILPIILGRSYGNAVEALRWLALIPLLRSFHFFLGDALSGAGFNAVRTFVQVVVAIVNVGLNLYFIPHWAWRGAAWTSLMSDSLLVLGFAGSLALIVRYPALFPARSTAAQETVISS